MVCKPRSATLRLARLGLRTLKAAPPQASLNAFKRSWTKAADENGGPLARLSRTSSSASSNSLESNVWSASGSVASAYWLATSRNRSNRSAGPAATALVVDASTTHADTHTHHMLRIVLRAPHCRASTNRYGILGSLVNERRIGSGLRYPA